MNRGSHVESVAGSAPWGAKFFVGHVDDPGSMAAVCDALHELHGPEYRFGVKRLSGACTLAAAPGWVSVCFVVAAEAAHIHLQVGDTVRGVPPGHAYESLQGEWGRVVAATQEELWPGDVICLGNGDLARHEFAGDATLFQVETKATGYPLPTAAFLRYLTDRPGGCAAYPGAFRREALPPLQDGTDSSNPRGLNRINEHTLDMRLDRLPKPQAHHHGRVGIGEGEFVNHSETAIVLPRSRYDLPPVAESPEEYVTVFPDAVGAPGRNVSVPVPPGTVLVTPATGDGIAGHRFENAFAMLIAIPGFVSPHAAIAAK